MNTCEMVLLADKNGRTYKSEDLCYNKCKGFTDDLGDVWGACAYVDSDNEKYDGLNEFVHEEDWKELENE